MPTHHYSWLASSIAVCVSLSRVRAGVPLRSTSFQVGTCVSPLADDELPLPPSSRQRRPGQACLAALLEAPLLQLLLVYPSSMSAPARDDKHGAAPPATCTVRGTRAVHNTTPGFVCAWLKRFGSTAGCSCHIKAVGLDCYGCNKNYKKNGQFAVRTHARARTASDPCRHSPSRRPGAHGYRLCSHPASTVHLCLSLVQRSSSLAWLFGYKYSHPVALAPPPPLPFPCHSPPLA